VFEVILKLPVEPVAEATVTLDGATDKTGLTPDCFTVTVTEVTPEAENVTFALLEFKDGLLPDVVTVRVPLPVPYAAERLSQEASSVTFQAVFEVILKIPVEPDAEATVTLDGATDKAGLAPDCITVTVTEVTPDAEKVTFALLEFNDGLTPDVVTVRVLFPVPDAAERLSQEALFVTLQIVFELIVKIPVDPDAELTVRFEGETANVCPDPIQGRLLYLTSSFIIKKVPRP
jgi:hypothetical protein